MNVEPTPPPVIIPNINVFVQPSRRRSSWSNKKPGGVGWLGPLVNLIGIVVSGVVGIILGQLFVWWVMNTDPFETGSIVARYISDVVPAPFR